ncbi:MAG: restriction endonuclease [Pseudobutyrivibrio ruminis]|nr:restriction endonuclease [Pseudobutyrivibrio ruminis]
MAKIKDSNPKSSSGGYLRIIGNEKLSDIFVKAQSTVISAGSELEKLVTKNAKCIENLDKFINEYDEGKIEEGSYLCPKKVISDSKYKLKEHEPDFLIIKVAHPGMCYVIELKDGDNFDTKKSVSEKEHLKEFATHISSLVPFRAKYYICCFNQDDKKKIVAGFKKKFTEDEVITGKELCNLLGINYDDIVKDREKDTLENFQYIVNEVSNIPEVKNKVNQEQKKIVSSPDFYEEDEENNS